MRSEEAAGAGVRGAGRSGVANGIQMVGAGVPGAEVRAAHHTRSRPPPPPGPGDASVLCGFPFPCWTRHLQNASPCYQ